MCRRCSRQSASIAAASGSRTGRTQSLIAVRGSLFDGSQNPRRGLLNVHVGDVGKLRRAGLGAFTSPGPFAARLVLIHPAVGGSEKRLVRLAVLRKYRRADADSQLHSLPRPRLEIHLVDALLQFPALALRLFSITPG